MAAELTSAEAIRGIWLEGEDELLELGHRSDQRVDLDVEHIIGPEGHQTCERSAIGG